MLPFSFDTAPEGYFLGHDGIVIWALDDPGLVHLQIDSLTEVFVKSSSQSTVLVCRKDHTRS